MKLLNTLAVPTYAVVPKVTHKPYIEASDNITNRLMHIQSQPLLHFLSFGNQSLLACPMHHTVAALSVFPIDVGETQKIKRLF